VSHANNEKTTEQSHRGRHLGFLRRLPRRPRHFDRCRRRGGPCGKKGCRVARQCSSLKRGPNAGSRFGLDQPVTSAGRHPDSDIFLDDVSVSRRHAEFRRENGEYLVVDTGSPQRNLCHRKPVESVALANGDEIQMASSVWCSSPGPRRTDTPPARPNRPKTVMGAKPDIVGGRHHHVGHHSARQMRVIAGQTRSCWPRPDQVDQQRVVEPLVSETDGG